MQRTHLYGYDWIVWSLFLALPLVIFWQTATSLEEQGVASGGPMQNSALFPRMIAWLLLGLTAINGFRLLAGRVAQPSFFEPTQTTRLALIVTAYFIVYLLGLPYLGYHILTPILMTILLRLFGLMRRLSIFGGFTLSLAVAAVFQGLLNVGLPVGIFKISIFG